MTSSEESASSAKTTITVRESGPLIVKGHVVLLDDDGNEYPLEAGRPFKLCRCGLSKTRPFCDATHREAGFVATERVSSSNENS